MQVNPYLGLIKFKVIDNCFSLLQCALVAAMFHHTTTHVSHALPTLKLIWWVWQYVHVYKTIIEQLENLPTSRVHVSIKSIFSKIHL